MAPCLTLISNVSNIEECYNNNNLKHWQTIVVDVDAIFWHPLQRYGCHITLSSPDGYQTQFSFIIIMTMT